MDIMILNVLILLGIAMLSGFFAYLYWYIYGKREENEKKLKEFVKYVEEEHAEHENMLFPYAEDRLNVVVNFILSKGYYEVIKKTGLEEDVFRKGLIKEYASHFSFLPKKYWFWESRNSFKVIKDLINSLPEDKFYSYAPYLLAWIIVNQKLDSLKVPYNKSAFVEIIDYLEKHLKDV